MNAPTHLSDGSIVYGINQHMKLIIRKQNTEIPIPKPYWLKDQRVRKNAGRFVLLSALVCGIAALIFCFEQW